MLPVTLKVVKERFTINLDAHQHFWKLSRNDYGWLTQDLTQLYQDYTPSDIQPHLQQFAMEQTIVVQAAPTVEETHYLLDLYDAHPFIAGVVGWLDLSSNDFQQAFAQLRQRKGLVGLRPMLQDIDDAEWILQPTVLRNIEHLHAHDFPLDLLITPRHFSAIRKLFARYPMLRAVINHLGKPNIAAQQWHGWHEYMTLFAGYPNCMCKLSGFITEASHEQWHVDDFAPYITHVVDVFGPNRLMFGSDWPVCQLAGTYSDVVEVCMHHLQAITTKQERANIFGGNARTFYHI